MPPQHQQQHVNYGLSTLPEHALETSIATHDLAEYGSDILSFMYELEEKTMPVPSIIESQLEISWKMRKLLILWLVEVHSEYTLTQETLFLTIHILDRMASKVHISRAQYQLVGLAALWIAAKYEENHGRVPTLKNLCYMACNAFKDRELLSMERMILNHLKFDLGAPTSEAFLDAQVAMMGRRVTRHAVSMARYILQLSLVHRRFVGQRPSFLAKAALILSEEILREKFWLSNDTRLIACVNQLSSILADPPKQLFKKFSESKYASVAILARDWFHASRLPGGPNPTEISSVLSNPQRSRLQGLLTPPKEVSSPATSLTLGGSHPPLSSWTIPQPIAPHFSKTNSSMDMSATLLDYTPSGNGITAIPALLSRTMTSTSTSIIATRENSLLMHRNGSCIW